MPVVSAERFAQGLSWCDYLAGCTENAERRRQIYEDVTLTPALEAALVQLGQAGVKVLVLEEDWCGDAARSGPVLARLASIAGIEARWFHRDQNLDIMDQYLENGKSRSIPVFVFMTADREFLTRWGSRPSAVRAAVQHLLPLPPRDNAAFPPAYEVLRAAVGEAYEDLGPAGLAADILAQVTAALAEKDR